MGTECFLFVVHIRIPPSHPITYESHMMKGSMDSILYMKSSSTFDTEIEKGWVGGGVGVMSKDGGASLRSIVRSQGFIRNHVPLLLGRRTYRGASLIRTPHPPLGPP